MKSLAADINSHKAEYLKKLHFSQRFVNPCSCEKFEVHAYCMTAQIIKSKKIFCGDCG